MSKKLVSLLSIVSLCPMSLLATDNNAVNATIIYGADNNPHNLSKQLRPDEIEFFTYGEFKLRTKVIDTVYLHAKVDKSLYSDDARADEFKGTTSLTHRSRFKLFGSKFKYKLSANYRFKDKTYVSKRTGLVATNQGISIADRYDSEQTNYAAELLHQSSPIFEYGFKYQVRDKSYENYDAIGLSNFDHNHQRLELGFEYKASDVGRFFMNGASKQREYVNKRGKDLDGLDIANTNLIYNYLTLNLGYIYRPNDDVRWRYSYKYEERTDDISGYYNATSGHLSISAIHRISDYQYLRARVKYSKFSLVNQLEIDQDTLEEDNHEKQGVSAKIGYEWVLATLYDTNLAVYVDLEHSNFENSDPLYTYERSKFGLGIRWSAF